MWEKGPKGPQQEESDVTENLKERVTFPVEFSTLLQPRIVNIAQVYGQIWILLRTASSPTGALSTRGKKTVPRFGFLCRPCRTTK